ncbi:DEAD-box ATP-dependent RNA helicase 31-like protein [Tanacetum coccineum]
MRIWGGGDGNNDKVYDRRGGGVKGLMFGGERKGDTGFWLSKRETIGLDGGGRGGRGCGAKWEEDGKTEKPVKVNPPRVSPDGSESYLSETRFDQCAVSPLSLKAIKDAGYEKMTVVQEATLPVILKGKDVLAKARTGTGKTVAFLLPSIEAVVKSPAVGRDQKRPPKILVLVVCPTRELASQAAMEANKLIKYHASLGVQVVIGGTRLALEQKRMQASPCQILVATPGRLKDHIENTAGFATRLMGVKVLVLDEADHLLDMGFRKDIEKIAGSCPQGSDRHFCLSAHCPPEVLVFCTTAMITKLIADLLGELKLNVREIHSRKPQSYRTRVSDEFRRSKGLILVTSDVSARGVDYPDVTLVIQVEKALSNVEMKNKESAYQAWLGRSMGLDNPPAIPKFVLGKMGLKNVPGCCSAKSASLWVKVLTLSANDLCGTSVEILQKVRKTGILHYPSSTGDPTYLVVENDRTLATYGINAVCTHLGCVVPWNKAENKFMCPCHGSQYNNQGKVVRGPAPLSLALAHADVSIDDGKVVFVPWTETDFRTGDAPWWS